MKTSVKYVLARQPDGSTKKISIQTENGDLKRNFFNKLRASGNLVMDIRAKTIEEEIFEDKFGRNNPTGTRTLLCFTGDSNKT